MTGTDRTAARAARQPATARTDPEPPPPGGVLWTIAGDVRALLMLPAAFTMQVAHPAIAAGVDEYSVFRSDPWGRGERSLRSVQLWVYGGKDAAEEGRRVRRLHKDIQGTDTRGRRYHSLDPACYAWVHATGFPVYLYAGRYLLRRFTPAQEQQLYREWLQVGRILGLRDRDMPQTIEEYWTYWARMLAEEIEPTAVARELVATDVPLPRPEGGPLPVRLLLRLTWPALRAAFLRLRAFVTAGYMPPEARAAIGLEWSPAQERRLRRFSTAFRLLVPLLPERLRYLPIAYRARAAWHAGRR
ncbi:oxygenase MpaB family protein [Streptomyces sp. NRRL F-4474]|uniref:oxygenase MpaB family protein n=1 Tax=Streptomyces sp. NRRL F-4474 TaxID=1463851 RepID=UPI0004C8CB77|nr:oxygenase MpaB family protein [Streptomyces sp. NRRL F-4474]